MNLNTQKTFEEGEKNVMQRGASNVVGFFRFSTHVLKLCYAVFHDVHARRTVHNKQKDSAHYYKDHQYCVFHNGAHYDIRLSAEKHTDGLLYHFEYRPHTAENNAPFHKTDVKIGVTTDNRCVVLPSGEEHDDDLHNAALVAFQKAIG